MAKQNTDTTHSAACLASESQQIIREANRVLDPVVIAIGEINRSSSGGAPAEARILREFRRLRTILLSQMSLWFRPRIKHPFYPGLSATPAREAHGRVVALAGAFHELEVAAAAGVSAQCALFVMNRWDGAPLTGAQRDRLWRLFQVPTYAMLVDGNGDLVGFECEAQNGFHVPGKAADDSPLCECGRPGPVIQA